MKNLRLNTHHLSEKYIEVFFDESGGASVFADGSGYGLADGSGYGYGYGSGSGSGYGFGYGDGFGFGSGSGWGCGFGDTDWGSEWDKELYRDIKLTLC